MNRFKFTLRRMAIVPALLALTACAGLQDVDHRWCPPEEVVAAVPVQEKVTLQADALFKFDRGDLAGLLPEGRATLDELAEKRSEERRVGKEGRARGSKDGER